MIPINRIVRSRRKTVSLVIETDGSLTVRAPQRLGRSQIERMVEEKADWIRQRQEHLRQAHKNNPPHEYRHGELFFYLGHAYPLEICERGYPKLSLDQNRFKLGRTGTPDESRRIFTNWYRHKAREILTARVDYLARRFGYSYTSVKINSARTRWGSCGSKGTLNFTWRLVMAPEAAIDYVIIHELVHLKIKNHSHQFWEKVAEHMPEYHRQRDWLKTNGHYLTL